jgi:metal-responsive CopG/Arc/MetJ family transcriptional regulator
VIYNVVRVCLVIYNVVRVCLVIYNVVRVCLVIYNNTTTGLSKASLKVYHTFSSDLTKENNSLFSDISCLNILVTEVQYVTNLIQNQ